MLIINKIKAFDFTESLYGAAGADKYRGDGFTIASLVQYILNIAYGFVFVILLINLILTGIRMSSGGKKGLEESKKNLKYTFIGLFIVMFAFIITNIITGIFTVS